MDADVLRSLLQASYGNDQEEEQQCSLAEPFSVFLNDQISGLRKSLMDDGFDEFASEVQEARSNAVRLDTAQQRKLVSAALVSESDEAAPRLDIREKISICAQGWLLLGREFSLDWLTEFERGVDCCVCGKRHERYSPFGEDGWGCATFPNTNEDGMPVLEGRSGSKYRGQTFLWRLAPQLPIHAGAVCDDCIGDWIINGEILTSDDG